MRGTRSGIRESAPAPDGARQAQSLWRTAAAWIVLGGAAAVFLLHLGGPVYDSNDVARYAQMVLEMHHGHTLVPTMEGRPYHEAAPLAAWLPYLATWVLGSLSPLSVRLPSALAALATCFLVMRLGALYSRRAGMIAGAAFVLNELSLTYGRSSRIESVLGLAVTWAVFAFFAGTRAPSTGRRLLLYAVAGVGTALGVAAKGPAALALIGAALGPFLLYERRWRAIAEGGAIVLVTAAALTAAWFWPYLRYLGPDESHAFYHQFVLLETIDKVTQGYGKALPAWEYLVEIPPKLAPWSLIAVVALLRLARRRDGSAAVERLCASWLVFPVLLLSASRGKHMRYIVPIVPAIAVLAGCELDRWLDFAAARRQRWLAPSLGALGLLLLIGGLAAPIVLAVLYGAGAYAVGAGVACAGAGVATLLLARRGAHERALLALYLGAAAVVVFVYAAVMPLPVVARHSRCVRLAEAVAPHLSAADQPLWVLQSGDRRSDIIPSELALYLGNRWISPASVDNLPANGLILAPRALPGLVTRATLSWRRSRRRAPETWYLLEAGAAQRRTPAPPP